MAKIAAHEDILRISTMEVGVVSVINPAPHQFIRVLIQQLRAHHHPDIRHLAENVAPAQGVPSLPVSPGRSRARVPEMSLQVRPRGP